MDKKIITRFNGTVYITTHKRKKVLDTETVNYSFGSLQRILEHGLNKIDLRKVRSVLVLGLGGGSVIVSLRDKFRFKGKITAVELDPVIIHIANQEFRISKDYKPQIIRGDAFEVVKSIRPSFGLIIIDIYIHNRVPSRAFSLIFWRNIYRILDEGGYVIFNSDIENNNRKALAKIMDRFDTHYTFRVLNKVGGSNTLVIARKD